MHNRGIAVLTDCTRCRFDFCEFGEELNATDSEHVHVGGKVSENIGQILLGERIRYSPYHVRLAALLTENCWCCPFALICLVAQLEMKHNAYCKALCKAKTYNITDKRSASAYNRIRRSIVLEYVHHWYVW